MGLLSFDCTFKLGRKTFTWVRFSASRDTARAEFEQALHAEYLGKAKLVAVELSFSPDWRNWPISVLVDAAAYEYTDQAVPWCGHKLAVETLSGKGYGFCVVCDAAKTLGSLAEEAYD